jgi:hypothetical protein
MAKLVSLSALRLIEYTKVAVDLLAYDSVVNVSTLWQTSKIVCQADLDPERIVI